MISKEETQKLKDKIKELKEALEKEKEAHEKTIKEFEEFKAKHSKTIANLRKAMNIKPDSKKKPMHLGAPKCHKGYARHIPERIDYVKQLIPKRCPHCNTKLMGETQEIRYRHVTDIKLTSKAKTTRYDIHRKYCPNYNKLVELEAPNVLPHARFGLNLMLLVMYLRLGLRLPGNKVCAYFMDLFNLKISEGEIVGILKQLVVAFGDYYCYLEKLVKSARLKHTDTTSWRINGKNYFAWVFVACGIVLYKIRKRNNSKAALTVFGRKQKNMILVIDRFSALRALAEKAGFLLQLCWSHILQDSKEIARDFGAEGKYVHRKLKEIYNLANELDHKGTSEMVEQLKGEIFQLTQRHYKHLTVWKFVKNLYYRDGVNLFRFVTNPEIASTNNISERELRALVIIRKISYGSRSRRGANATVMLLSIIQTLRLQKKSVLEGLQTILNNPSGY
ncbi:MAG: IS66 family transposase [Nanoarchaeota archaeon]|nr:IS66 family transposase [Nanoarchaeota archaeon]